MPQYQAPDVFPDFAEGNGAVVAQPTSTQQQSGFTLNQRPTAQTINWLFRQIGRSIRWLSQGVNAVLVGSQAEPHYRLIGGGMFTWNATSGVLSWSDTAYIQMAGLADTANTIAAGTVTLAAGQVAYVQSNAAFTTQGDTTNGSAQLKNVAFESGIAVGSTVSGPGIPSGATVVALSTSDGTITLSANATATASQASLVFATAGALTVKAADVASFSPAANSVILARCIAATPNTVYVGVCSGQMRLLNGEAKSLLGNGYIQTAVLTAGTPITAGSPVYLSNGVSDQVTVFRNAAAGTSFTLYSTLYLDTAYPGTFVAVGSTVTSAGGTSTIVSVSGSSITVSPALPADTSGASTQYGSTSITISRNAGRLYAADASGVGSPQRGRVLGVVTNDVAKDGTVHVVKVGSYTNYSGLTPGSIYYLSPAAMGAMTATAPTGTGQSLVGLGQASSATTLLINPSAATAASVIPSTVYKSVLDAGTFASTSFGSGIQPLTVATYNASNGALLMKPKNMQMTAAGSVVGMSIHTTQANGTTATTTQSVGYLYINGTIVAQVLTSAADYSKAYAVFAKGNYPFAAGDVLFGAVNYGASGVSVSSQVQFTLEFTP